ncbi:DNA polymerase IV [Paenisporosarcina cavernae]|uniref:DNA polymerase IV n=1 Tax=Paenisporosarcina cavernae TaxID=2320858 RepID=A0A385YVI3_9BACL|nr:DNA polymerase IV [Paenisporosarcina cavernae]AYC29513.1 DNA polymerase IV [Paenisporosarcina cavernae]
MAARVIFHIDMNSFFASVEQSYDTSLKGKPVAVAGDPTKRRGIVVTCSYEARAFGVYTTMNVREAKMLCPELIVLPPNFARYKTASVAMFDVLRTYSYLVEPTSIDEGYLDLSHLENPSDAIHVANDLQQRLSRELDLPSSIGIAPNKFLAKMASNMKKPMGITVLRKRDVPTLLWPLEIIKMHGIGESTATKLNHVGVFTIGDLATMEDTLLIETLGKKSVRLKQKANGEDNRPVDPDAHAESKSVGNSTTLEVDESDIQELRNILVRLSEKVARRLQAKQLAGTTLSISIRYADWNNVSRSVTKNVLYYQQEMIAKEAIRLFEKHWDGSAVRLLGITISNVEDMQDRTEQLSIFTFQQHAKEEPLLQLLEKMQKKFGEDSIQKGTSRLKKKED